MAWTYLAESADSQSPLANGLDQSPIAKSTLIVKVSFSLVWYVVNCEKRPFGMMLVPYAYDLPTIRSTFSTVGSPARISALQDMERAWRESEVDCFSRSCAWPKKSSPNSYLLKTYPLLQVGADFRLLEKLPKSGMTVDGMLYPLKNSSIKIEKDGFVLPNLTASDSSKGPAKQYNRSGEQASMRNLVTISYRLWNAGVLSPEVCEKIMGYRIGWTELEPWAMQWFLLRQKKRSKC